MSRVEKLKKAMFWILIAAMLMTVVFIFSNSLKAPDASMDQSTAVGDIMADIFPPETKLGEFIQEYIRKIGHFCEYGILGVEAALFVIFYLQKRLKAALVSASAAMCVALVDETLQYFSDRGPAVFDVWIDVSGFVCLSLLTYAIARLVTFIRARVACRRRGSEEQDG